MEFKDLQELYRSKTEPAIDLAEHYTEMAETVEAYGRTLAEAHEIAERIVGSGSQDEAWHSVDDGTGSVVRCGNFRRSIDLGPLTSDDTDNAPRVLAEVSLDKRVEFEARPEEKRGWFGRTVPVAQEYYRVTSCTTMFGVVFAANDNSGQIILSRGRDVEGVNDFDNWQELVESVSQRAAPVETLTRFYTHIQGNVTSSSSGEVQTAADRLLGSMRMIEAALDLASAEESAQN